METDIEACGQMGFQTAMASSTPLMEVSTRETSEMGSEKGQAS
jgi:hypothetical protein